jgi:hypothetical protein
MSLMEPLEKSASYEMYASFLTLVHCLRNDLEIPSGLLEESSKILDRAADFEWKEICRQRS